MSRKVEGGGGGKTDGARGTSPAKKSDRKSGGRGVGGVKTKGSVNSMRGEGVLPDQVGHRMRRHGTKGEGDLGREMPGGYRAQLTV